MACMYQMIGDQEVNTTWHLPLEPGTLQPSQSKGFGRGKPVAHSKEAGWKWLGLQALEEIKHSCFRLLGFCL